MEVTYVFRIITEVHATDISQYDLVQIKEKHNTPVFYVGAYSMGGKATLNYIKRIVDTLKITGEKMKNYGRIKCKDGFVYIPMKNVSCYSNAEFLRVIVAEALPLDQMYYATREEPHRQMSYNDHINHCIENFSHRVRKSHCIGVLDYYTLEIDRIFLHSLSHMGKRISERPSIRHSR
jgi:hypothetical protein